MFSSPFLGAQITSGSPQGKMGGLADSTNMQADSIRVTTNDSILPSDTVRKKDALDAPVDYSANDSIVFTIGNWGYLYGDGHVNYKTIALKAENIAMSMDSSMVNATFGLDSIGSEFGFPIFSDGGTDYESKTMKYNFKTKKGYITNVITQQGEGYIVAEKAKKNADDSFFMCNGKYTTCDNHDHPHFYMMLTKAKVRPKKNVVTGPAYLVIEGLPLPIALPFGFFPFSDKYSSGIIMPSYGDELERGFNLRDGGYYFAINDNIDLALTGEIYTKGSWGLNARSTYKKRYRYSGSFDASYLMTKLGDKDVPETYSTSKDFRINWTHSQDPKANMYRTLSASVNYSTSSYSRNQLDSYYNSNSFSENTKSSTVNLTQRFPNSPFSLSASMSIAQRSQDSTVDLTLPQLNITMSRIYPFKRKQVVGSERWYEKIQFSYTGELRNSIRTKEDKLFSSNLQKDWKNAMRHSIPISATFNVLNHLNITPSINYTERWYTSKSHKRWDVNQNRHIDTDTIYGFNRVYDFNYALNFQTKLYGMYEPLIGGNKVKAIRHVFTPSISFSGNPDFSDPRFGYYERYYYYDGNGELKENVYSLYDGAIFGSPGRGKQGNINFQFENNIEAKINTNDSTKIISLIDNLGIGFSYNMMADSLKWSDITTNIRLKLSKTLTVNLNATFDPYTYGVDSHGNPYKQDKLRIQKNGTIGRLKRTSYSISPSINQDTFKKWFGKDKDKKDDKAASNREDSDLDLDSEEGSTEDKPRKSMFEKKEASGEYDDDGYLRNEFKWSLSASYSMGYGYDNVFDTRKREYKMKLTHNLGLNGSIQPTKNWSFTFNTSYDFDNKRFADVSCNLTRNLHCWAISASFRPIGPYTSYYVSIRANSSMLQDLKYEQRGRASSYDPAWY